jgi:hypothetical protein
MSNMTVARSMPRDPVDERVVGLRDERPRAVVQALDDPQLPQRLVAVELLAEDARDEVAQLLVAARGRQRGVAHVVLEAEVGVVDPQRPAAAGGRERQPLAIAGDEMEAVAERVEELVHLRRRALEGHEGADVHVRVGPLLVQEGGVYGGQPVEVLLGHGGNVPVRRTHGTGVLHRTFTRRA